MTSIKRRQKEQNDKIDQNDGAQFSSISARDSSGAITKKKVSQPTLISSEEIAVLEALQEKHEKDDKKNLPAIYRDRKRWSSVEESGPEALGSVFSITKEALDPVPITKKSNFPETSKKQRKRKNYLSQEKDSADKVVGEELVGCRVRVWWTLDQIVLLVP
ncbi:hypothetical protein K7X08_011663 [Anisodus acutangulus]|uniref:Uncharacterized protein n=1 Tax=Anisodus acutangulus TaxID=402998 RepID=A0A9Q1MQG5_9SOLA|nr:hypothetical protein K7X08_011663 [Anisodus acutangulus]